MDFYENMRELGIGTVFGIGVGCYTQKLALADKWTSGVSLANSSFLFVKGAVHVLIVEVLLPFCLALRAELQLLCGLLQYI